MYFYVFDAFLREKKYEGLVARIENRFIDLGIQGKSEKLTILKSMDEVVAHAIKLGADTMVIVGNDQSLSKMIKILVAKDIVLGYIPVGEGTAIAHELNIPTGPNACDVIAQRYIRRVDLGKANTTYFLSTLTLPAEKDILLECDNRYFLEPRNMPHTVSIHNLSAFAVAPDDGKLEAVLESAETHGGFWGRFNRPARPTVMSVRRVRIRSYTKSLKGLADGQTVVKTPVTVEVVPKKLRIIVGKRVIS